MYKRQSYPTIYWALSKVKSIPSKGRQTPISSTSNYWNLWVHKPVIGTVSYSAALPYRKMSLNITASKLPKNYWATAETKKLQKQGTQCDINNKTTCKVIERKQKIKINLESHGEDLIGCNTYKELISKGYQIQKKVLIKVTLLFHSLYSIFTLCFSYVA